VACRATGCGEVQEGQGVWEHSHRRLADELSLNHGFSSAPARKVVDSGDPPLKPALLRNDLDRFNALHRHGILDAPADAFDRITKIAAAFFRVSIAIVSVVDNDRPWFKSQRAIDTGHVEPARGLGASATF
jgi:hypothetical protein